MRIDQVVERQAHVDERFDLVLAAAAHVLADAVAWLAMLVDHLAVRSWLEVGVVLEEIAVAVDVGHHQLLVDR